ncbi:hypothetical protein AWB69_08064 [Caballeronia udeis]|uniref:Uncharacterized protein n=1 Tax=Caballeronia udeis TaxID=1232866 RepID=A0A158JJJ3_9BURK|nr:hypothetical protein AWB69_08064 [Caballeronia udeis]
MICLLRCRWENHRYAARRAFRIGATATGGKPVGTRPGERNTGEIR